MTQNRQSPNAGEYATPKQQNPLGSSYYTLLGLHPSASVQDIRRAYRDLSKLYHPDTTELPAELATSKFQLLNEAYATLSSPERRQSYDRKIGYSSIPVVQPLPNLHQTKTRSRPTTSSAYLDATDRPLSPGEVFALFILGVTFIGCLLLAIAIGLTRGESVLQPISTQFPLTPSVTIEAPIASEATAPVTPEGLAEGSFQPTESTQPETPAISLPALVPPAVEPSAPLEPVVPAAADLTSGRNSRGLEPPISAAPATADGNPPTALQNLP